jgi:chromate transporter
MLAAATPKAAGLGALAWTAFKVGALSFGGGFVIVPLMQADAVHTYHWMTNTQFLSAVALGQVTPGPVVSTVAAVGYSAHGLGGGVMAATIAFIPSFLFVLLGGRGFRRLRRNAGALAFLDGAGPAAIGAIAGAAIPLTGALQKWWQVLTLVSATLILAVVPRAVVRMLLMGGFIGAIAGLSGAALPSGRPQTHQRAGLTQRAAPHSALVPISPLTQTSTLGLAPPPGTRLCRPPRKGSHRSPLPGHQRIRCPRQRPGP